MASLNLLQLEEIRSFCDCPSRFQTGDLLGTFLGTFFGINGIRLASHQNNADIVWGVTSILFGGIMIWIHTRRFVYGSELGVQWE